MTETEAVWSFGNWDLDIIWNLVPGIWDLT
jgi:hypothetical protein